MIKPVQRGKLSVSRPSTAIPHNNHYVNLARYATFGGFERER
jgi:hypothetical protein